MKSQAATAKELKSKAAATTEMKNLSSTSSTNKFSQMVAEAANQYKIPHYGELSNQSHFEVIKPVLVDNKFVAYLVKGEDTIDVFETMRRYNEFFLLR